MKKNKIFLIILFILGFLSFTKHQFYVSVTEINENKKRKTLEITSRIFIDDLEKALEKNSGVKIVLTDKINTVEEKNILTTYLNEKIKLKFNNSNLKILFLASELENKTLVCYLQANYKSKLKSLNIENKLLIECFDKQQNLVHTKINNEKKSFLFTKNTENEKIY